jgi:hypothetical protein
MDRLVLHLTRLAAAFPRDNASEATLAVYAEELGPLDEATVLEVLAGMVRSSRRFPALGEILDEYRNARIQASRSSSVASLPLGRAPMPDEVRQQISDLKAAFDERAKDLELSDAEKADVEADAS